MNGNRTTQQDTSASLTAARDVRHAEFRRRCRRWLLRHPFQACHRSFLWWQHKHIPPWRLRAAQLCVIDPRPLTGAELEGLKRMLKDVRRG